MWAPPTRNPGLSQQVDSFSYQSCDVTSILLLWFQAILKAVPVWQHCIYKDTAGTVLVDPETQ